VDLIDRALRRPDLETHIGRFLYYKFKICQVMSEACSDNACRVLWLQQSLDVWRLMISTTGYRGTDYASAEPMKEYAQTLFSLGSHLCSNGQHSRGLEALQEAESIQRQTLDSFDALRIAPTDIMEQARVEYSNILFNLGLCSVEMLELGFPGSISVTEQWLLQSRSSHPVPREVDIRIDALLKRLDSLALSSFNKASGNTRKFRRRMQVSVNSLLDPL